MKKYIPIVVAYFLTVSIDAHSETGPSFDNLKPTRIFNDGANSYYIEFNSDSMPNCSANRGGRLKASNPLFKEIYSSVLVMMAAGGVRGRINFERNGSEGAWSACEITGFDLRPN